MKTIVALVDFSDVTSRLMEQVTKVAIPFDARVTLLHVVPEGLVLTLRLGEGALVHRSR